MANTFLKLEGIAKDFSGVQVLKDINITIEPGKVYGIAGENGAGKSTLCNMIVGSLAPSSGRFITETGTFDHFSLLQAKRMGVRMVYQELQILPDMSVAENIFVGNEVANRGFINRREMFARTQELLKDVGLNIKPQTIVRNINIAARQLVEIARANSTGAKLIILDEPTSSLSESEAECLFNIIRRQKEQGTAFIFISHRIEELIEICDQIYVLKDGCMVTELDPKVCNENDVIRNMVGRSYEDFYNRERTFFGKEVLKVRRLTSVVEKKGYSNAYPPKDVSFTLHEGEVLGVAGLVGAGRTEMVKLIFGADKKTQESEICIDGKKVEIRDSQDAMKHGMIWVTEDRKNEGIILDFSIRENLVLPILKKLKRRIFIDRRKEEDIVDEYISTLKVKTTGPEQRLKFLSGGNQQKVVIAKWLAAHPRIMVLDEPTRGIDVGAKVEIYRLINELTAKGIAVLLISSELPEVMGMSDRIIVMHEGRITGELAREDFSEEQIMAYAIGRNYENEHQ